MRSPVVRLIAVREIRDQIPDRRTLLLILGLPVLMYPLFVGVGLLSMAAIEEKKLVIGVVGVEHLPLAGAVDRAGRRASLADSVLDSRTFPPLIVGDRFPEGIPHGRSRRRQARRHVPSHRR